MEAARPFSSRLHTDSLRRLYQVTRQATLELAVPLTDADATVQSMPEPLLRRWASKSVTGSRWTNYWTNRWMARHWLLASHKLGVPYAFIVDAANRVAWIGHPMETERPLTEIVDGIWDLPTAAHAYQVALTESKEREKFLLQMEVLKATDGAAVVAAIDKGIAAEPVLEKMSGICSQFRSSEDTCMTTL